MKKQLIFILIFFISLNICSQISFEKGYYIDNDDSLIECYIKNKDWSINPTEFLAKHSIDSEPTTLNIHTVKEFGIYNESKYIRSTINIDKSSHAEDNFSTKREPIYEEETLFLKVILEGRANLYYYKGSDYYRYFYSIDSSKIVQLIYKPYKVPMTSNSLSSYGDRGVTVSSHINKNEDYKNQLLIDLTCQNISSARIQKTHYYRRDLMKIFNLYNQCNDENYKEVEVRKNPIHITLRPGRNKSSIYIVNAVYSVEDDAYYKYTYSFENEINYSIGIEAEFILPGNKQKWSVIVEPTYQSLVLENGFYSYIYSGYSAKLEYKSIEMPIGFRHYFYLSPKSKIFINAVYLLDLGHYTITENDLNTSTKIKSYLNNFAFGFGYKYNDRLGIELRFKSKNSTWDVNPDWVFKHKSVSLMLGYTIF